MGDRSSRSSDESLIENCFFRPRSLAVIGASVHPDKVGHAVLANVIDSGYPGELYPVNPGAERILGLECYTEVGAVPGEVDLAVIIVPAGVVPDVVTQCTEAGIRAGIVISAGFRETGIEGRRLEKEMVRRASEGRMRLLGPNCLGIINTALPINASFSRLVPPGGPIGVISQSGAMCTSLLDWAREQGLGYSTMVSLGNGADLVESDFLRALADDDGTSVISMYLEGVSDGRVFFEVMRYASERKPVLLYKAGSTRAGARAASSHTGALAGSESAYAAICEQTSALRVESIQELTELARCFAAQAVPAGPSVAIVTNAGGPGIIAADACERAGLRLASISQETADSLAGKLPRASSLYNPIDVLGDAGSDRYEAALEVLIEDPGVEALLVVLTPQAMTDARGVAEGVIRARRHTEKTIICSFMGAGSVEEAVSMLEKAGVPNIGYPDRAVGALARMDQRRREMQRPVPEPVRFEVDKQAVRTIVESYIEQGINQVSPEDCRHILDLYGIPNARFRVARDVESALETAREFGYPVALKVVSPQILHKTDVGGVKLGVEDDEQLEESYLDIMYGVRRLMPRAEVMGIGVQKMAPQGKELILGMARDPQFGPLVMVGLGGIYVEAFNDVSFRLAPLDRFHASSMLKELKAFRLLQGVRGEEPADIEAVEEMLLRISQLATENPSITEMDINPLMVYNSGDGCTCVDIRITLGGDLS